MAMLLGLLSPTSASGTVLGASLEDPASYLGRVGALIETPAFWPGLSGIQNLRALAALGGHENTIKFGVGLLLTTFGCFWAAEGAGVDWPGDELSLLGVLAFFGLVSFVLVRALRRRRELVPVGAEA
jgi:hypothetical protein